MSRSVIVAAVAGLALLSGCDQTPEPSPPPTSEDALTTTTDEAETTSEGPTTEAATTEEPEAGGPPEMPEEATEQTEAGAEAFVEHYFESLNEARETGNTESVADLAMDGCKSCANFEESATTGGLEPFSFEIHQATLSGTLATVPVDVDDGEAQGTAHFRLQWDDGWSVATVQAEG